MAGEFLCGFAGDQTDRGLLFLEPFHLISPTIDDSFIYAREYPRLRSVGTMIGSNDLWIASAALIHRLPVLTKNAKNFRRITGLEIVPY